MKILIIDDNRAITQSVELALAKQGIICDTSDLGEDGIQIMKLNQNEYDLIILDIMLPDISGLELLKTIRMSKKYIPILILSGLSSSEDKIRGLGFGADDYLSKPFNIDELVARVKAIIRRSKGYPDSIVTVADLKVNFDAHVSEMKGKSLHLTTKEQGILELLATKKDQTVTKEQFLSNLYNGLDEPELKIIDVFICKLRKKLFEASGGLNYIETVWGRGYSLKNPDDIADNQTKVAE
jgi:two-component system, cell cycle response regulator CtrA